MLLFIKYVKTCRMKLVKEAPKLESYQKTILNSIKNNQNSCLPFKNDLLFQEKILLEDRISSHIATLTKIVGFLINIDTAEYN